MPCTMIDSPSSSHFDLEASPGVPSNGNPLLSDVYNTFHGGGVPVVALALGPPSHPS